MMSPRVRLAVAAFVSAGAIRGIVAGVPALAQTPQPAPPSQRRPSQRRHRRPSNRRHRRRRPHRRPPLTRANPSFGPASISCAST